ncbi:MAG: S-adenosylmethionine synthetase [Parcubacteria group bacterium Gr01-1014_48]|nr:MAG: S-adenosylmethionine synthetase [Parcubacteria group bacterium Greene0416_14]TSC74178.1 MAG: S-adenosylmethionine synthetase [Parcubacteria group bacterium Gr01-1014_48]TSD00854.1 MAG: S-adenosylmethionine synthetase [Parcubacteria group bacterium Greene1014_15]TSD07936.1 MAG: S-adenosylmethionine synthetase [Parcubacteria group bacterium Greene0714_4]
MLYKTNTYTVESVTSGHPDKVCDQISDAILDACLEQDPYSRVAVETFGSHGLLVIGGEVTTKANVDYERVARDLYHSIGYTDRLKIIVYVAEQSGDIAQGVDIGGAGDQGIMYGYATDETPEYLPKGVVLVHNLTKGLEYLRRKGGVSWLRPDGKAQVTIMDGEVATILVSCQHAQEVSQEEIREILIDRLITPLVGFVKGLEILVNPTGSFVKGGFTADAGLTGRKIIVDTYGGLVPHGGGAFSGKDCTKVDRSAAYMSRFVAKQFVAEGLAKECLVSVAYAIGRAEPVMVEAINERGENILDQAKQAYDFRPQAIIERLGLRRPIFRKTAAYGHFGKKGLPWEEIVVVPEKEKEKAFSFSF